MTAVSSEFEHEPGVFPGTSSPASPDDLLSQPLPGEERLIHINTENIHWMTGEERVTQVNTDNASFCFFRNTTLV